jgi:hypothetical protein
MIKVVLNSLALLLAIAIIQGCKGSNSSPSASQYYAPMVAGAPSQGKPLNYAQYHANHVPVVKCRQEDKDPQDKFWTEQKKQLHKHRHDDDDDKGIVICHVPFGGMPPQQVGPAQTLCLSEEGVLAHFNHPLDYLGVCVTPTATPTPTPTPIPTPTPTPVPPFGG